MAQPALPSYTMALRVRYVECDMQDRVFNAHYLTWADMAHTEAIRELVGGYQTMVEAGVDLVVVGAELRFRAPARFDDELTVRTVLQPPGTTSLQSEFSVHRGDELLAEITLTHVCVESRNYTKQPWPQWLRELLPR